MDVGKTFDDLDQRLVTAESVGVLPADVAEDRRRSLRRLEQAVTLARYRGDGSLPPLLRQVKRAREHIRALTN